MSEAQSVDRVLSGLGDLPAMPEVVSTAVAMMNDPGVDMADVAMTIQRDPALTAKLLKVSNSPYYGMRQVVGTLKLALVILGAREVRNVLLGVSVMETFSDDPSAAFSRVDFWRHSFHVASIAKSLSTSFDLNFQGEDFIAGLLHDIGKLVLYRQLGEEYASICLKARERAASLSEMERKNLGFDHSDAAFALAKLWNMPDTLKDALWMHHPADDRILSEAKDPSLAAIVRIANSAVQDSWSNDTPDPATLRSCQEDEAWGILAQRRGPLDAQARAKLLSGFINDLEDSTELLF